MTNFGNDIKDSVIYGNLIDQIAPPDKGVNRQGLLKTDLKERAEETLKQADKLECRYTCCRLFLKRDFNIIINAVCFYV